jgi:hypothetical protein
MITGIAIPVETVCTVMKQEMSLLFLQEELLLCAHLMVPFFNGGMSMTIREYVNDYEFEIVGKLKRVKRPKDGCSSRGDKLYVDEGGNYYWISANGDICVCMEDGCF